MPMHILIVDDDQTFCEFAAAALISKGHRVATELDPRNALGVLRRGRFDVVVLDLRMPELDGLTLLKQIREAFEALPVLVVTAFGTVESTREALRLGATDFVTKPVDPAHLDLRVRGACEREQARYRANTDGLTGLYNHRYLHDRLRQEIERAERYRRPLSLVMVDVDRFKSCNDALGHPRGDEILCAVAQTLLQVSRATDVAVRYGGDEFTLILPETGASEAGVIADRVRRRVAALRFRFDSRPRPGVTASLGIAFLCESYRRPEELIAAADRALFRAKELGRDRVCVAGPPAGRLPARPSPYDTPSLLGSPTALRDRAVLH